MSRPGLEHWCSDRAGTGNWCLHQIQHSGIGAGTGIHSCSGSEASVRGIGITGVDSRNAEQAINAFQDGGEFHLQMIDRVPAIGPDT